MYLFFKRSYDSTTRSSSVTQIDSLDKIREKRDEQLLSDNSDISDISQADKREWMGNLSPLNKSSNG